mmetsp:Transcript_17298/g.43931  ORF Transcript_17298/g.43931 Transcript_17298/m.43931 type:complete len:177 (-) Transcript_17298:1128-1658(-)
MACFSRGSRSRPQAANTGGRYSPANRIAAASLTAPVTAPTAVAAATHARQSLSQAMPACGVMAPIPSATMGTLMSCGRHSMSTSHAISCLGHQVRVNTQHTRTYDLAKAGTEHGIGADLRKGLHRREDLIAYGTSERPQALGYRSREVLVRLLQTLPALWAQERKQVRQDRGCKLL